MHKLSPDTHAHFNQSDGKFGRNFPLELKSYHVKNESFFFPVWNWFGLLGFVSSIFFSFTFLPNTFVFAKIALFYLRYAWKVHANIFLWDFLSLNSLANALSLPSLHKHHLHRFLFSRFVSFRFDSSSIFFPTLVYQLGVYNLVTNHTLAACMLPCVKIQVKYLNFDVNNCTKVYRFTIEFCLGSLIKVNR